MTPLYHPQEPTLPPSPDFPRLSELPTHAQDIIAKFLAVETPEAYKRARAWYDDALLDLESSEAVARVRAATEAKRTAEAALAEATEEWRFAVRLAYANGTPASVLAAESGLSEVRIRQITAGARK